ncbi:methylated-DNA--[protein]-cysteine S-methyltransferase [Gracilibacillus sp. YIM 98692]|uniref:methylated-DNA--[protein]-cysteine S-methyltransferase n=1 Tax=Gracilibacillus sp. YIM 98692 TaxID=2663532 RepID=UPI0013D23328|nr:methylated-DNA--[protein]-cysteine S-methyltransferase [Gracilibacillus sp. YIM 98692]
MVSALYYTEWESPIGTITLFGDQENLYGLELGRFDEKKEKVKTRCQKHQLPDVFQHSTAVFEESVEQLNQYFSGNRERFALSFQLFGTTFQQKVWQVLQDIPFGETWSYKDVAEKINSPKAVRAVGGAVNKNPISIIVPCHRVIGHNGKLVGFGGGLDKKSYLLHLEKGE